MAPAFRSVSLLAVLVALAWPLDDRASAHSGLRFSSPLDGATLGDSPTHVQLTFLEKPEPALSTIRVVDAAGAVYHDGTPQPVESDPLSLTVRVRPLGRGVYTVHWRVVSAVDGHASAGVFVFGVLVAPTAASGASGGVEATASTAEAIARAIFLAGLILVIGAAAARLGNFGLGRERGLAVLGWMVSIVGLALLVRAQQRVAGVGFAELTGTSIGRALVWRSVAIGVAGVLLALVALATRSGRTYLISLGVAGMAIAALAAVGVHATAGHAGAGRWPLAATIGSHVVHIAVAGIWLGGLAALVAGVRGAASEVSSTAVRRFSRVAAVGLVVVIATGIVRSVIEIPSWDDLISTTYGRVLLAKVGLVIGIAALGAMNRWRNVPRAAPRPAGGGARTMLPLARQSRTRIPFSRDLRRSLATLQPLRRTASVELALGAAALAVTGVLGTIAPPAASQSIPGIDVSGTDFGTTVRVRLTAASDHPGPNRFVVRIDDYDAETPVRADRVSLRFTPLDDPGVPSTSLALMPGPDDGYAGSGANLTYEGRWRIGVQVERAGSSVEVPLAIETRSTPQPVSILRIPGQVTNYTVLVPRLGFIRFSADPERPGRSQVIVSCLDVISEYRRMEQMVVTADGADGARRQQPVRRLDEYRFAAEIELRPGRNRIVATAHSADGTRMRAAVEIAVLEQ